MVLTIVVFFGALCACFDLATGQLCGGTDPQCGLSATEAQLQFLTPYEQLLPELQDIANNYNGPTGSFVQVGPLVKNGNNGGLLDIDVPIETDVCSALSNQTETTIREAVVCTVTNDPIGFSSRGNSNPDLVGLSTHGRDILGLRMGTGTGHRIMYVSQVHGTEAQTTEALLQVAREIATTGNYSEILEKFDILFVLRANPDGGEPTADNLGDNYPLYLTQQLVFNQSEYFFRENVDTRAGGGFGAVDGNPLSEPDFFGTVGRGYNLNRYMYANLDSAIRPVEAQGVVAALHAFQPEFVVDLHGDIQKSICSVDLSSVEPGVVLEVFPTASCEDPAPPTPTLLTARELMVELSLGIPPKLSYEKEFLAQVISTYIRDDLENKGLVGEVIRFSQTQTGTGAGNDGGMSDAAAAVGAVSLLFEVPIIGQGFRPAPQSFTSDGPQFGLDTGLLIPCYLEDAICVEKEATLSHFQALLAYVDAPIEMLPEPKYCEFSVEHLSPGTLPSTLGWGDRAVDELVMIPGGGLFGVPVEIGGTCPLTPPTNNGTEPTEPLPVPVAPGTYPPCSVCADGQKITIPNGSLQESTCEDVDFAGENGLISPDSCVLLFEEQEIVSATCGCQEDRTSPPMTSSTGSVYLSSILFTLAQVVVWVNV